MIIANVKLHKAVCGYALRHGFSPRAVIIPVKPCKANSYARWQVDAIGLDKPEHAKTLPQAKAKAYHYAAF